MALKPDLSKSLQSPANVFLAEHCPKGIFRLYLYVLGCLYFLKHSHKVLSISASLPHILAANPQGLRPSNGLLTLRIVFGIFEHYFEKLINAYSPLPKLIKYLCLRVVIENRKWLDQNKEAHKGCLLITGHFGAVEYLPLALAVNGYQPTMVVRFKTPQLKETLTSKSRQVGIELIDADQANVGQESLRALRNGRILITVCDEIKEWRPCRDNLICVFGIVIPRDRTLDVLYRRTRVPALLGLMRREKGRFVLHLEPLADGSSLSSLAEKAWQALERTIVKHPEQWYQWQNFGRDLAFYRKRVAT